MEICALGRAGLVDLHDPRLQPALETRRRTGKFKGELNFVRQDGSIFPGELSSTLFRDVEGTEKTSMFIRDSTGRKQAEESIRAKDILLHEMSRMAQIGGCELDATTRQGTWTEEIARIHDLNPEEPTNVELGLSFYQGESREKIELAIQEAIELGRPYDLELTLVTAKGNHKWVRTVGCPLKQGDRVVKIRGIFQDITARKQAEARLAEQLDELHRWHAVTLGREERIIELKREVNELFQRLGEPIRYPNAEKKPDPKGLHDL